MTDFRTLCAELVDCLEKANWPLRHKTVFGICLDDARAALTQPEPQGPTDEEVYDLADVFNGDPVPAIRRALELWGRPAIKPVPQEPTLSKRSNSMTDFRVLCQELMDAIDSGIPVERIKQSPLAVRVDAALAQPEPPSLKEEGFTALELLKQRTTDPNIIEPLSRALEALPE